MHFIRSRFSLQIERNNRRFGIVNLDTSQRFDPEDVVREVFYHLDAYAIIAYREKVETTSSK